MLCKSPFIWFLTSLEIKPIKYLLCLMCLLVMVAFLTFELMQCSVLLGGTAGHMDEYVAQD